jgi:predicted nuclease of predicted toxin-antitoxin system
VRFIVDAQLPPALARLLVRFGHDAIHVSDAGLLTASDRDIWNYASRLAAALITKDEDFVTMRAFNASGPPIIWVRLGNATNRTLLAYFTSTLSAIVESITRGETIVVISEP